VYGIERASIERKRSRIDVLVAYTAQAMKEAVPDASEFYMKLYCDHEVQLTNSAFHASGVDHHLNPPSTRLVKDDESGGLQKILDDLVGGSRFKDLRKERKTLKADVLVLLVSKAAAEGKEVAGIARIMDTPNVKFAPQACAVVTVKAMSPYELDTYTFPHEIAHVFGCCHAKGDEPPCKGATAYAHGFRFKSAAGEELRTLMAYAPGRRINQLSNPDLTWDAKGDVTGDKETADNARVANDNGAIVEQFSENLP
jgi:hypothetical protein